MRRILQIGLLSLLAGCAYPQSRTDQGAEAGYLYFPGAPVDARVIVDGSDAGAAGAFDGKQVLSIPQGTHRVELVAAGRSILNKRYYVNSGARVAVQ